MSAGQFGGQLWDCIMYIACVVSVGLGVDGAGGELPRDVKALGQAEAEGIVRDAIRAPGEA